MKKLMVGLLAVGLILSLGAWGLAAEKTVIKYWQGSFSPEDFDDIGLIEKFEAANPDIDIQMEFLPGETTFVQKVMLGIASGNMPDVLEGYIGRMSPWWYEGVVVPLDDTLTEEDLADYIPSILDLHRIDGNLFAFPRWINLRTWGGNKTLLERAGATLPEGVEWKRADFLDALDKVAAMEGDIYPLVFFANGRSCDYITLLNFQMFGASLYTDGDYTRTTLNSEAGVQALEWMIEQVAKGYAPKGVSGLGCGEALGMIRKGQAVFGWAPDAMTIQNTFDKGEIDYIPEFGIWGVPVLDGLSGAPLFTGGNAISVFKGDNEEAAIRFVRWLMSTEALTMVKDWGKLGSVLYPRKSVTSPGEGMKIPQELVLKNGVGDLGLNSPYYLEVRDLQFVAIQKAFTGQMSAKEALDEFAEKLAALWE